MAPASLLTDGKIDLPLAEETIYSIIDYETINVEEFDKVLNTAEDKNETMSLISELKTKGTQNALAKVIIFPVIMVICYFILIFYFKSKGGYKPVELN